MRYLKKNFAQACTIAMIVSTYMLGAYLDQQDEIAAKAIAEQAQ